MARDLAMLSVFAAVLPGCQGGSQVVVPDVQGETIVAAARAIQSLGLCVLVQQGNDSPFRDIGPIVARQDPRPGSRSMEGAAVTFVMDSPENIAGTMRSINAKDEDLGCDVESESDGAP